MYTLYKVRVKLMYTLYNDLTIFSKKWLKSGLLQFLTTRKVSFEKIEIKASGLFL